MITKVLADFVADTTYEKLPEEAVTATKKALLDFLGVALAGAGESGGKIVAKFAKETGGIPEAGVIGAGFNTSAFVAALANGTAAHVLDYDDCYTDFPFHPSVAILPAVLALGQKLRIGGNRAIEAYVVGFEVACKVGSVVGLRHRELGWHNTATIGGIGAAAAASRVLGLKPSEIRMALGIAASLAGGLTRSFGTMTKPLHAGNAASKGVMAASLAAQGFTAYDGILEAQRGFCDVFGWSEAWDLSPIAQSLGSPFSIVSPGICFKLYPSCHGTHLSLDAMLDLRREHGIRASDVREIECRTSTTVPTSLFYRHPKTDTEARFSMEYCLSRALVDGEMGLSQFGPEKILDPEIGALIAKVRYSHPDGMGMGVSHPQEVVVRLQDGGEFSKKVEVARGDPRNPIGLEELTAKYRACAQGALPPKEIDMILELVLGFETVDDIGELMRLAAGQTAP